jgi:cation:H+ antiporter
VVLWYDLPVKIATGVLLYAFLWRRGHLSRGAGFVLVALYFGYTLLRGALFPVDF